MVQINTKSEKKQHSLIQSPLTYNEIIHYLDTHWAVTTSLTAISQLDESFGFPSKKLHAALVSGTSGKSTTIHYACKLLQAEGIKVGAFITPHINLYNERFVIDNEQISHKNFTALALKVMQTVEDKNILASTKDILTMMAFLYFADNNVNFAIFENAGTYTLDPVMYCDAQICAVTRIIPNTSHDDTLAAFENLMLPITSKTHFLCADQNKQNLQIMQKMVQAKGGQWQMPTRKLAPLPYPFEQLHGRCGALAQKLAHTYHDIFITKNNTIEVLNGTLLSKPKGVRGRPTLEAKKISQDNPSQSLELFWNQASNNVPYRFEFITNTTPMILLDNADNIDALTNLFLGYRLLAYKNQFKNVSLIIGCHQDQFNDEDLIKELRNFGKKASGTIAFCPINNIMGEKNKPSWDVTKMVNVAKNAKIKVKAYKNFTEAFAALHGTYNDSKDLIIITGSSSMIQEYVHYQNSANL